MKDLIDRLNANFSLLSMITPEEGRAESIIARAAVATKRQLYSWSCTKGLRVFTADGQWKATPGEPDPAAAALALGGGTDGQRVIPDSAILILLDFSPFFRDPAVIRALRDSVVQARERLITGIFLGPQLELPPELKREVANVELPLPGPEDLTELVKATCEANSKRKDLKRPEGEGLNRLVEAASGLTTIEAENAFSLSLVSTRQLEPHVVATEKARAIKASGALEILKPPPAGLDSIGGLGAVKDWIHTRGKAFSPEARAYGLPYPKGALLIGVQGCGKSATTKAAAAALGVPAVRLDVGAILGALVGEREANVRAALKTIDAVAPCLLMIDELEKAFAGSGAGKSHDGGTSSRVLGTFLTWMQDHTSPVFLMATANDVTALPPELLRKGRWDTMLFVDLPDTAERVEILRIHLKQRNRDPKKFALAALAEQSEGFSGAELEQSIVDAMFTAFADGAREIELRDIEAAINGTVPLSRTMGEQIGGLREWAKTRCVPASGVKNKTAPAAKVGRRVGEAN